MHSNWLINSQVTVCTVTSPCIWVRFGPAHVFGPDSAHFKEKNQKYLFQHFIIFPRSFYVILINIGQHFYTNPVLKYPVFGKNFQKYKKTNNWKKREKNVFVHTAKCLKAKKSYCIFHTPKNNILACILALITSLLKSREHRPKSQKQQKFYFVWF